MKTNIKLVLRALAKKHFLNSYSSLAIKKLPENPECQKQPEMVMGDSFDAHRETFTTNYRSFVTLSSF